MSRKQSALVVATLAIAVWFLLMVVPAAVAQSYHVIYNFTGSADGANPYAGVTLDRAGNLYGTAYNGGAGYGTAYRLNKVGSNWTMEPLYSFKGKPAVDGAGPASIMAIAPNGLILGTTLSGGNNDDPYCGVGGGYQGCGTIFSLQPPPTHQASPLAPWKETVLWYFTFDPDGAYPSNNLVLDSTGNLYGTGENGGYIFGDVWELSPAGGSNWTQQAIFQFTGLNGPDGGEPEGGVVFGPDGYLYGTTSEYGNNEEGCCGAVFQLTPGELGWNETTLYDFQNGSDGTSPIAGVIADAVGNLYGSTPMGGSGHGGTIYEVSPNGSGGWSFSTIYSFPNGDGLADGPYANLVMDSAGNLYGTTYLLGRFGWGAVFKLTKNGNNWTYSSLHDFTGGADGANPRSALVFDNNGNLYGTASIGGSHSRGVIFEITPQ